MLHRFEKPVIRRNEVVTFRLNGTGDMKGIFAFDSLSRQGMCLCQDFVCLVGVGDSILFPCLNCIASFAKWVSEILIVKDVRLCEFKPTFTHLTLNKQLCFGFQMDSDLALSVKGAIESTVVQVYSHCCS
jgi:hypothetical protein